MPAIVEFAKKHWVWLAGAGALIVAVLYLRSRQASQAAPVADSGAGFGAGATSPSAPANMGTATGNQDFQNQLQNLQLQDLTGQLAQRQKQYDLANAAQAALQAVQGKYASDIESSAAAATNAQLAAQGAQYNLQGEVSNQEQKQLAKTGISCPGKASPRLMPDAQGNLTWQCRQKTSGIPLVSQVIDAVSNAIGGVQAGAGSAAQQVTQAAGAAVASDMQAIINNALGINVGAGYGAQGAAVGSAGQSAGGQSQAIAIQGNTSYSPANTLPRQAPPPQVSINTGNAGGGVAVGSIQQGAAQMSGIPPASGIG